MKTPRIKLSQILTTAFGGSLRGLFAIGASVLALPDLGAEVIVYDGFQTISGNTSDFYKTGNLKNTSPNNVTNLIGFAAGTGWSGGTGTIKLKHDVSLTHSSAVTGSNYAGAVYVYYKKRRALSRPMSADVGVTKAEAGLYVSSLIKIVDDPAYAFISFGSNNLDGQYNEALWNSNRGIALGVLKNGSNYDLVVRHLTGASYSDEVIRSNVPKNETFLLVAKIQQGTGSNPDKIWATSFDSDDAYHLPSTWTVGGTTGLDSQCLDEAVGANDIQYLSISADDADNDTVPGVYFDEVRLATTWTDGIPGGTIVPAPALTVLSQTSAYPIPASVTFKKDGVNASVTGFVAADLNVTGATVDNFTGSGHTYTFNLVPGSDPARISVSIPAGAASETANNRPTVSGSTISVFRKAIAHETGLVLWYPLNDASTSSTAKDWGPNQIDGVISGNPARVGGQVGTAFEFDGNDDKIIVPNHSSMRLGTYTLSVWVRPVTNNENWTGIAGRGDDNHRNYNFWLNQSNSATSGSLHH